MADRFQFARRVMNGEEIPRGYGIAWRVPHFDATLCLPVPFNQIARALREVYWRVIAPRWGTRDKALAESYVAGYAAGGAAERRCRAGLIKSDYERGLRDGREKFISDTIDTLDRRVPLQS
jgi:hypothetical protein